MLAQQRNAFLMVKPRQLGGRTREDPLGLDGGLRERAAHKPADPTRSENRMPHRAPPSNLWALFYTAAARLGGVTDA